MKQKKPPREQVMKTFDKEVERQTPRLDL